MAKFNEILKRPYRFFMRKCIPWQLDYFVVYSRTKCFPNLIKPQNYSVYIFRDNLLGRHNKRAYLADKLLVRDYVSKRGLSNILTELYGAWEDASTIEWNKLPQGFALKCNHSCAMNIICQDKDKLDKERTIAQLNKWLKEKHPVYFEQHYKRIKPMVICEELIPCMPDGSFPIDYKIHCANGKPVFIQVCFERTKDSVGYREIYSTDWKNLHYVIQDYHYSEIEVARPKHLEEMLEYASILSKGLEYARVDLYDTPSRVIFGEITLTPMGGWLDYFKPEALKLMGDEIRNHSN